MSNNIGILDPEGKNNNPLNNKPYSNQYLELGKIWSTYPAYIKRNEIIEDIKSHNVILLTAGTGSGKTVLTPKFALHATDYKGKIAITLPKKIITQSAAEFAAKTLDVELGSIVGYQFKGSPSNSKSDKTQLLYATDGTIVQRLLKDPKLSDFDMVIIDEAHERKVQIDFLLYLLRETLKLRPNFKVIIMSATVNEKIFRAYFKAFEYKHIDVGGKTNQPIISHFLDKDASYDSLLDKGFDILVSILKNDIIKDSKNAHDVIFFVVSSNDASKICDKLGQIIKKEKEVNKCEISCQGEQFCIEVYSGMKKDKENLATDKDLYKEATGSVRKIVVATPVAESSLTIDGIKYVIDTGYQLFGSYDPEHRARRLDKQLITNAQAKQRKGRAGRTEPGECYHLYTEDTFENGMKKFPEPDIRTSDISAECLKLLDLDTIRNTENLQNVFKQFIEPPQKEFIKTALLILSQHGAIEKGEITKLGSTINQIPVPSIMMAESIIFGKLYKCSIEVMKIVTLMDVSKLNINELFQTPAKLNENKKLMEKFEKAKKIFKNQYGDHLSLLKIFDKFETQYNKYKDDMSKLNEWAYKHFLKLDLLLKALTQFKKLKRQIGGVSHESLDLKHNDRIDRLDLDMKILACLIIGFRTHTAAQKTNKINYRTRYSENLNVKISRSSFLNFSNKLPKNVFYTELFISSDKAELNIVSKIPKIFIDILN